MFQSHYDVGGHKFANIFQAFDRSIETGQFCYYNLQPEWIEQIHSIQLQESINVNRLHSIYADQLQTLRQKYKKLVLAYSGGTDSHTILDIALKNNIFIDEVFIEFPGMLGISNNNIVDKESIDAYNFVKNISQKKIGKLKILKRTIEDYNYLNVENWWKNEKYCQDNLIRLRPFWGTWVSKYYENIDGIVITGHEKPRLRYKNNKFYFFLTDTSSEYKIIKNCLPFFLQPKIVVPYTYLVYEKIKDRLDYFTPVKDRHDFFWHIPKNNIKTFYESCGMIFLSEDSKNYADKPKWGCHLNFKNQGILNGLEKNGHKDVKKKLLKTHKEVFEAYSGHDHLVESDGTFVKTVERYSQMFELNDYKFICKGHDV